MPAYVVVEIDVDDPETFGKYKALVEPIIEEYGGRYLVRGGAAETLEGGWSPSRMVILEFESKERAKAWWFSPDYEGPKKLRQQAARSKIVVVEGV